MKINFYDDPLQGPRAPEEVEINQLGLYVHPDGRRVAVGFDITPFQRRPSVEVTITNARGEKAGSLTVIETLETNFTLTMHLRDKEPTDTYEVRAELYYTFPEKGRVIVHGRTATFDATSPGQQ